jgi:F-type H+-transporting ATPase subunit gamma
LSELIIYGKKGKHLAVILNKQIAADFPKIDKTASMDEIYPIAQLVTKFYETGQYRQILIVYNHFVSTLVQKATIKQLLPFVPAESSAPAAGPFGIHRPSETPINGHATDYLFEPDPSEVLDHLLPRIIESQIYQAILESDASEHSARMIMMKNATDAAGDLITDLTLTYNQIRQNKITTELAEITAGKIALE